MANDAMKYESMVGGESPEVQDYTLKNMKPVTNKPQGQSVNTSAKGDFTKKDQSRLPEESSLKDISQAAMLAGKYGEGKNTSSLPRGFKSGGMIDRAAIRGRTKGKIC